MVLPDLTVGLHSHAWLQAARHVTPRSECHMGAVSAALKSLIAPVTDNLYVMKALAGTVQVAADCV